MGRKHQRNDVEYRRKSTQAIIDKALEWRTILQNKHQHAVDVAAILEIPPDRFPFITVTTFDPTKIKSPNVMAWSSLEAREIELSPRVKNALRYDDLDARWETAHEFGHIALDHPGYNLFRKGKKYTAAERRLENEADTFALNFLAPFHLAKDFHSVEEYVARFRIPYDKARIRKRQVDALKSRVEGPPEHDHLENPTVDSKKTSEIEICSPNLIVEQPKRKRKTAKKHSEQFLLFDLTNKSDTLAKDEPEPIAPLQNDIAVISEDLSRNKSQELEVSKVSSYQTDLEDRQIIERLLQDVNRQINRRRVFVKHLIALLVILVGALPLTLEAISGILKFVALSASGIIGASFAFFQIFDEPIRLDSKMERWSRHLLRQLALKRGLGKKLDKFKIGYLTGKFEIQDPLLPALPSWLKSS